MRHAFTTPEGARLTYERRGSGPVLVAHPGGPGFSAKQLGELAGLGEDFTLVLFNPRGTGGPDGSTRPVDPCAYALDDYVADLEALRQHLGLERMNLLGFSHGGIVILAYAATYTEHVGRLIAVGALAHFCADSDEQAEAVEEAIAARAGEPWYEDAVSALEAMRAGEFESEEEIQELLLRQLPVHFSAFGEGGRAYIESIREEVINGDALRLFNEETLPMLDLREELGKIAAPTLVLTGERDFVAGPSSAEEIAAGVPDATLIILPGSGHLVFVEAPDAFRCAVRHFLCA